MRTARAQRQRAKAPPQQRLDDWGLPEREPLPLHPGMSADVAERLEEECRADDPSYIDRLADSEAYDYLTWWREQKTKARVDE